jgi:NodT family efflux transporter outer membrane factor (OMF) lipoprotein
MLRWVIYLLVLISTGCTVGPNFKVPRAPATQLYTKEPLKKTTHADVHGGQAQVITYNEEIPASWWRLFHSEALNDLIMQGIRNNPSLESGKATLRRVQENLRAEIGATMTPTVDSQFTAQRERTSLLAAGIVLTPVPGVPPAFALSSLFNLFSASVSVAYNVDIFGGTRRHIEAMRASLDYQQFELEATYLTLTSNIVTTAISRAALQSQIDATKALIISHKKHLKLIKNNYKLGHISRLDVLSEEEALKEIEATLPPLKKHLAEKEHALSVYIGLPPSESHLPKLKLRDLHLPEALPLSLPCALTRQRPDIRSAEALIHKATAELGVATADLFPKLNLSANYGYDSSILSSIFNPANKIWDYAGQVSLPILHGGEYLARRRAAIAALQYAKIEYRKIVLEAFQNVADVLRALEYDAELLEKYAKIESVSKSRLILVKKEYQFGKVNMITLIDAKQKYEDAKIKRIQAEANRYADTAALFQALGGGWWNRAKEVEKR